MEQESVWVDYIADGIYGAFVMGNLVNIHNDPARLYSYARSVAGFYGMQGVVVSSGVSIILGID